jgi:hypothetical protein
MPLLKLLSVSAVIYRVSEKSPFSCTPTQHIIMCTLCAVYIGVHSVATRHITTFLRTTTCGVHR